MPSIRARISKHILVRYMFGSKLKRAGTDIAAWRKIDDYIIRMTSVPEWAIIEPLDIAGIGAEWVRTTESSGETAAIYLHGGGFVMGSPACYREFVAYLAEAARTKFLVLDYRLAPEHPFPAALNDVLTVYNWLLEEGFSPDKLVIGGDSAGGGLALQTLLAMKDEGIPMPAAAYFLSPPLDWVCFDGESYTTKAAVDPMLTREMCVMNGAHYVGDTSPDTPLLYPIGMDLSGLPPLCIYVGEDEVLLSDSVRLAERALEAGVEVTFKIWPGMWHVFPMLARFVPESRQAIAEVGHFIANHLC